MTLTPRKDDPCSGSGGPSASHLGRDTFWEQEQCCPPKLWDPAGRVVPARGSPWDGRGCGLLRASGYAEPAMGSSRGLWSGRWGQQLRHADETRKGTRPWSLQGDTQAGLDLRAVRQSQGEGEARSAVRAGPELGAGEPCSPSGTPRTPLPSVSPTHLILGGLADGTLGARVTLRILGSRAQPLK